MGDDVFKGYSRLLWAGIIVVSTTMVASAQDRPALVEVDPVQVEVLSQTMPVIGRFVARQRGSVAAATNGPVAEVFVEVGDRVKAGDPLIALDEEKMRETRNLQAAALAEARAAVNTAIESLTLARQELKRLDRLKNSAAFSQARLDDKRQEVARYTSEVVEAEAAVARAQANLSLAEIDLTRSTVVAPFNGVVVDRKAELGAYISVGQEIAVLINDEDMEVEADVPASRVSGLTPGRKVRIHLSGEETHSALVRAVIPEENALTRTRAVRFTPDLNGGSTVALAAGQSVTVMVPIGDARNILSVHKDSVLPRGDGNIVYVVDEGQAKLRQVLLGDSVGNRFEVLDGLREGELVITRGNERVSPGQSVSYQTPDQSNAATGQDAPAQGEAGG